MEKDDKLSVTRGTSNFRYRHADRSEGIYKKQGGFSMILEVTLKE
ncbi:hypothetical protein [Niabella agricola]|nr:hypothetical protein [Niabella agricola]